MSRQKPKVHGATALREPKQPLDRKRDQTIKVLEWITAVSTQAPVRSAAERLIMELGSEKNESNKEC